MATAAFAAVAAAQVRISPSVWESLREETLRCYMAAPRGGVDAGGLLLGRRTDSVVEVSSIEPLRRDYSLGPRFKLSQADQDQLRALVQQSGTVLGWYCSHTRSELSVDESDESIWDRFVGDDTVAVILKPRSLFAVDAAVYRRRNLRSVLIEEIKLKTGVPVPSEPLAEERVVSETSAPAPEVRTVPAPEARRVPEPSSAWRKGFAAGAVVSAVLSALFFIGASAFFRQASLNETAQSELQQLRSRNDRLEVLVTELRSRLTAVSGQAK